LNYNPIPNIFNNGTRQVSRNLSGLTSLWYNLIGSRFSLGEWTMPLPQKTILSILALATVCVNMPNTPKRFRQSRGGYGVVLQ